MKHPNTTRQATPFAKLGDNLIAFRLNNQFISDNKFLFVAPQEDFCRSCFLRRYSSQVNGASIAEVSSPALRLARNLDTGPQSNHLWRWFLIEGQKVGKPFELVPYDDCPVCGKEELCSRQEANLHYEQLLINIPTRD